ncbi:MAG: hypothetical protein K0V04_27935, partial [Deltaproteobacteria bacterium]|nr:hypothetical protein [Deltaproteobacteria bacterium]
MSLPAAGCDKLLGDDEQAKDDASANADEAKKADEEAAKKKADEEAAKKKADEEAAKKKADEEAAKKKADEEAAKKAAEDAATKAAEEAAKNRPVNLSELGVKSMGGMFGGSGMIEVTAKAKINQALGNSTYVHVKSLCKKDDQLVADVGYLNAHYAKPLEQYGVGEEADVKGTLYSQGLSKSLSPCQFAFRVGGIGGGLSVPVGEACWDGSKVVDGACDPALVAVAMSGAKHPIEVNDLQVERSGGLGSTTKGLNLTYLLRIN